MQATFKVLGTTTRAILGSDADHEDWTEIVNITKYHKREERLEWDIFKLPHHCSYLTLGPKENKGVDKTTPVAATKWLFEEKSNRGCIIISPSWPIPAKGTQEDKDIQPPHRQAKNYYVEDVVNPKDGEWKVTMEHPKVASPEPITIEITRRGAMLQKRIAVGAAAVTSVSAPRAGKRK
jgi:hypothetical protein